jgi:hypothetical protein
MKSLTQAIADLGENPTFVAFNAHAWFAYAFVTFLAGKLGWPLWPVAAWAVTAAALKEFLWDAREEVHPVQTAADNWQDLLGYCAGILLAVVVLLS